MKTKKYITTDAHPEMKEGIELDYEEGQKACVYHNKGQHIGIYIEQKKNKALTKIDFLMENSLFKLSTELKSLLQNEEQSAKRIAESNIIRHYKFNERIKTFDLISKKKFYKKELKKINSEIKDLDIEFEERHSVDYDTGELKTIGAMFGWAKRKTQNVLEKHPFLTECDYSSFKNHFMIEFAPIHALMVKLRERHFILNQLKHINNLCKQI